MRHDVRNNACSMSSSLVDAMVGGAYICKARPHLTCYTPTTRQVLRAGTPDSSPMTGHEPTLGDFLRSIYPQLN
jgi:hypothetical protein